MPGSTCWLFGASHSILKNKYKLLYLQIFAAFVLKGEETRKSHCKEDRMSVSLSKAFTLMQAENLDNFLRWVY